MNTTTARHWYMMIHAAVHHCVQEKNSLSGSSSLSLSLVEP